MQTGGHVLKYMCIKFCKLLDHTFNNNDDVVLVEGVYVDCVYRELSGVLLKSVLKSVCVLGCCTVPCAVFTQIIKHKHIYTLTHNNTKYIHCN